MLEKWRERRANRAAALFREAAYEQAVDEAGKRSGHIERARSEAVRLREVVLPIDPGWSRPHPDDSGRPGVRFLEPYDMETLALAVGKHPDQDRLVDRHLVEIVARMTPAQRAAFEQHQAQNAGMAHRQDDNPTHTL